MASSKQPSYHHGDLADALLDATVEVLADRGPAQLSLREIARVAGVSHGAPAHHFGDKAGLLTAVATRGHRLLARMLNASQSSEQTAEQNLLAAGQAYIRFAVAKPAHFAIMFQSDQINPDDPDFQAAGEISRGILQSCVRELLPLKSLEGRNPNAILIALWSQVHGFASLWLAGNFGDPNDMELLQALIEDMLTSLKL